MITGFEMWPGYGGLIYDPLNEGYIMALKVLPATNMTTSSSTGDTAVASGMNSTTTTSGTDD